MQANEMTFGVEIETLVNYTAASSNGLSVGNYHRGHQVPYLPAGWVASSDSSVSSTLGNEVACEIVSPVLKGAEGLQQVAEVIKILKAKGHRVNATCGVHVHIGWDASRTDCDATALARLVTICSYAEKGIYAVTGTKARERGHYCGGLRKYGNADTAKKTVEANRYHLLNLKNLAEGRMPTVEFRAFSGSLNALKVVTWVQVCLGLVERATSGMRNPVWNPKPVTGGLKKNGEGQSEAERLICYLGWSPAYAARVGKAYGWIAETFTQEQAKGEMRRMAKQYDAMA